jgi:hypothetical protein
VKASIATVAVALLLALPAAAGAAVERFAAPGGSTTDPTCAAANPCELHRAVEVVADSGDIVTLLPGDYAIDATLEPLSDRIIRGAPGQPRPRLFATVNPGIQLPDASVLRHVELRISGQNATGVNTEHGVTIEDCVLMGAGPSSQSVAATRGASLVRDTTVLIQGTNSDGIDVTDGTTALRNVTIVGTANQTFGVSVFTASGQPGGSTADIANSIIRGGSDPDSFDIDVAGSDTKVAIARLTHSNFATKQARPLPAQSLIEEGEGNQTAAPLFVNRALGDIHQLEGSPTIDKGLATADRLGDTDIDGEARVQGAAPDIGADESTAVAPPDPPAAPSGGGGTPPIQPAARDDTAPGLTLGGVPRSVTLAQLKKGLLVELTPSEAAALELELRGTAGRVSLASAFDLTLTSRTLGLASGKRTVRLKPRARLLTSRKRAFNVELRVTAIDAARNRTVARRTIKVKR